MYLSDAKPFSHIWELIFFFFSILAFSVTTLFFSLWNPVHISAASEHKSGVSDNFPLNAIIWSCSCQCWQAALHKLPEGTALSDVALRSPLVCSSKCRLTLNTRQTSESKKRIPSAQPGCSPTCALQKTLHHCSSDRWIHEGGHTVRSPRSDQKGVVPSFRASSGGHHCFYSTWGI